MAGVPDTPRSEQRALVGQNAQVQLRLGQQLRDANESIETLQEQLNRQKGRTQEAEDEGIKLKITIAEVEELARQLREEVANLKSERTAADEQARQEREKVADLTSKLTAAEEQIAQGNKHVKALTGGVAEFAKFVRDLAGKKMDGNPALEEAVSGYDAEIAKHEVDTLQMTKAQIVGTKSMLMQFQSNDSAALLAECAELKEKLKTAEEKHADALKIAKKEKDTLRKRVRQIENGRNEQQKEAKRFKTFAKELEYEVYKQSEQLVEFSKIWEKKYKAMDNQEDSDHRDDSSGGDEGQRVGEKRSLPGSPDLPSTKKGKRSSAALSGSPDLRSPPSSGDQFERVSPGPGGGTNDCPPTPGREGPNSEDISAADADASAAALVAAAFGYVTPEEGEQAGAEPSIAAGSGKKAVDSERSEAQKMLDRLAEDAAPFTHSEKTKLASVKIKGCPVHLIAVSPLTDSAQPTIEGEDRFAFHLALKGVWATGSHQIAYKDDDVKKQLAAKTPLYWKRVAIVGSTRQLAENPDLEWSTEFEKQSWNSGSVKAMGKALVYVPDEEDHPLIFRSKKTQNQPMTFHFYKSVEGRQSMTGEKATESGASSSSSENPRPPAAADATPQLPGVPLQVQVVEHGRLPPDAKVTPLISMGRAATEKVMGYLPSDSVDNRVLGATGTNTFKVGTSVEFARERGTEKDWRGLVVLVNPVTNTRFAVAGRGTRGRLAKTSVIFELRSAVRTGRDHVLLDVQGLFREFNVAGLSGRAFEEITFEDIMQCVGSPHKVQIDGNQGHQDVTLIKIHQSSQNDDIFKQHHVVAAKVVVEFNQFRQMLVSSPQDASKAATSATNFRYVMTSEMVIDTWQQASSLGGHIRAIFDADNFFQGFLQEDKGVWTFWFGHTNPSFQGRFLRM